MSKIIVKNITSVNFNRTFVDLILFYFILLQSLSLSTSTKIHGSTNLQTSSTTTMHVTCGTDIVLTCPISSRKKTDEVISWFRPNSSQNHIEFIAIGDLLFPEYSSMGRFNLHSAPSRLAISNVLLNDQGLYTCKSSSAGQHTTHLVTHSQPHLSPSSPLLLYPVNRTFSITCSLLCPMEEINLQQMFWLVNGELLNAETNDFLLETISRHTQQLTVYLNGKMKHFTQANYTCVYDGKEATILVRRRTKDELHRLPRQEGSSAAYLLQTVFDKGTRSIESSRFIWIFLLLFLLCSSV